MMLIVDTNIMFSYFKQQSPTHSIFEELQIGLFAPQFALAELGKHASQIRVKADIDKDKFNKIKKRLITIVEFVPESEYRTELKKASKIASDLNDIDFFALALRLDLAIWSNDKAFKKQEKVIVFNTSEIIRLLRFE